MVATERTPPQNAQPSNRSTTRRHRSTPAAGSGTAAAPAAPDPIEQLKQLAELRDQGILTEEEFAAEKAKVLAG